MGLIQRAQRGEFKPYLYEQFLAKQSSQTQIGLSQPKSTELVNNTSVNSSRKMSEEERLLRAESIRQFRASLCR